MHWKIVFILATQLGVHLCQETLIYEDDYYPLDDERPNPPAIGVRTCGPSEATCANGQCVDKSSVCNGRRDCADGSDERGCRDGPGCEPNEFQCDNKRCILKTWICDSEDDCGDGSDERYCATNPPGSPCKYFEHMCSSRDQCIPKSFHCDGEVDCQDQSDEIGCTPPIIVQSPPPLVTVQVSQTFIINCTAMGVPRPEIVWRLNWGHVPEKCKMTSVPDSSGPNRAFGELTCSGASELDQGAYSCEAINSKGSCFAGSPGCGQPGQDAIVVVKKRGGSGSYPTCPPGTFDSGDDCVPCFCFGSTNLCSSADLNTIRTDVLSSGYKAALVTLDGQGGTTVQDSDTRMPAIIRRRNGYAVRMPNTFPDKFVYLDLPPSVKGQQIKSYGGKLKYQIMFTSTNVRDSLVSPDVIIRGNGINLYYVMEGVPQSGRPNEVEVHLSPGNIFTRITSRGPYAPASREEIMMVLDDVESILIKTQYGPGEVDAEVINVQIDTADTRSGGLGKAPLVEQCQCPRGHTGLSCQDCAPGFEHQSTGQYKGICVPAQAPNVDCPPGYYSIQDKCYDCPCPSLTNDNTPGACRADSQGVSCDQCPPGSEGRKCERCLPGYDRDQSGKCSPRRPTGEFPCNYPDGSRTTTSSPQTGRCICKAGFTGDRCEKHSLADKCEAGQAFQVGEECVPCFCMGIPSSSGQPTCQKSRLNKGKIVSMFEDPEDTKGFRLTDANSADEITDIRFDESQKELFFDDFGNLRAPNYFWNLPPQYLGNKVKSYGGDLKFSVMYSGDNRPPVPAPLVEISDGEEILRHYDREFIPSSDQFSDYTVKLDESQWQDVSGQPVSRQQFLKVLAQLDKIQILATHTARTYESGIQKVEIDVGTEDDTGDKETMSAVEECMCPPGYQGTSCEQCAPGYTRDSGPLLGSCKPCECNGHSEACNPETGVCVGCKDGTTGDHCERCEEGRSGDATMGRSDDCLIASNLVTCSCDPKGSESNACSSDNSCIDCKMNVEGRRCDRCVDGTFMLSAENEDGCSECWCSGITDRCTSGWLFWSTLRVSSFNGEVQLTDKYREKMFEYNTEDTNALSHWLDGSTDGIALYWSLPSSFLGNKLTSYGGNVTIVSAISAPFDDDPSERTDAIIVGNGLSLHWTGPDDWVSDTETIKMVPLKEPGWQVFSGGLPRPALREDFMKVLSNIEAILIRASTLEASEETYLRKAMIDIAIPYPTGFEAPGIERCICPSGYAGTSCEKCSLGYYRDQLQRIAGVLGNCKPCPCSGNEEYCESDPVSLKAVCHCKPGFSGEQCEIKDDEAPATSVIIEEPKTQTVNPGQSARFKCNLRLSSPTSRRSDWTINWTKDGRPISTDSRDRHIYSNLIINRATKDDGGFYICTGTDGVYFVTDRAQLIVRDDEPEQPPEVRVEPNFLDIKEGESAEYRCEAPYGSQVSWTKEGRPVSSSYIRGNSLYIPRATSSEQGEYTCTATSPRGLSNSARVVLYVRPGRPSPVSVSPSEITRPAGKEVVLYCQGNVPQGGRIDWTHKGRSYLPRSSRISGSSLIISNGSPEDSGVYVCTITGPSGQASSGEARVTISPAAIEFPEPRPEYPSPGLGGQVLVRIEPERQTIGEDKDTTLKCIISGTNAQELSRQQIVWSKVGEDLKNSPHIIMNGDALIIRGAKIGDRGVYVCTLSPDGRRGSAVIEVERRELPSIEMYPEITQTIPVSASTLFQCRALTGIPTPKITWTRVDGRPLSTNIDVLDGGVLRINQVTGREQGQYQCTAENDVGSVNEIVTLTVQEAPKITLTPSGTHQVQAGSPVRLTCSAIGDPDPTVEWRKISPYGRDFLELDMKSKPTEASAIYAINSATKADEGSYVCKATNDAGEAENVVQLIVVDDTRVEFPESGRPQYDPYRPDPSRPTYNPNRPGSDPSRPEYDPYRPEYDPNRPGSDPRRPEYNPNRPGSDPRRPEYDPNRPGSDPRRPDYDQEREESGPSQDMPNLSYDPNSPNYKPNNPYNEPNKPDYDPYMPTYDPINPTNDPSRPNYDPRKPTINEPAGSQSAGPSFDPNSPNYNPFNPYNEPNKPNYDPYKPSYDPINPTNDPSRPNYDPRRPTINESTGSQFAEPSFDPNSSNYKPNNPYNEPNKPDYDPYMPTYDPINPTNDPSRPNYDPRKPTINEPAGSQSAEPSFDPNSPNYKPNNPYNEPNKPDYDPYMPTYDPMNPTNDPSRPNYDPRKPTINEPAGSQSAEPSFDPNSSNYKPYNPYNEPNKPDYDPYMPTYDPINPTNDPSRPNYDPRKPTINEPAGSQSAEPSFDPNSPNYNPFNPYNEPNKPNYDPYKPSYDPINPTNDPSRPNYDPRRPTIHLPSDPSGTESSYDPNSPHYNPLNPYNKPNKPSYDPNHSGNNMDPNASYNPDSPYFNPVNPYNEPNKLNYDPYMPSYNPDSDPYNPEVVFPGEGQATFDQNSPNYNPINPYNEPNKPNYDPYKPTYDPINPGNDPSKPNYDQSRPTYGDASDSHDPSITSDVDAFDDECDEIENALVSTNMEVPLGGIAELNCLVVGDVGSISRQWERGCSRALPQNSQERNGVLYLMNIQPSDAGIYVCKGTDPSRNDVFSVVTRVIVKGPPIIRLDPARQTVLPGERVIITCDVSGDEPITVQWSKSGFYELPPSIVLRQDRIIEFSSISVEDQGLYICSAANSAGNTRATAEVVVQDDVIKITWLEAVLFNDDDETEGDEFNYFEASAQNGTSHGENGDAPEHEYIGVITQDTSDQGYSDVERFKVNEGDGVDLNCRLSSGYDMRTDWSRDSWPIPEKAQPSGTVLRIPDVTKEDAGKYVCSVNGLSQYVILEVDTALEMVRPPTAYSGCDRRRHFMCSNYDQCIDKYLACDGEFDCLDGSDENNCPPSAYNRYANRNGEEVSIDATQRYFVTGDSFSLRCNSHNRQRPVWSKVSGYLAANAKPLRDVLRFTNIERENSGTYRCSVGNKEATFTVRVQG